MKTQLSHEFSFEASHRLNHLGSSHPCYPLHGHSYRVNLVLEGEVDPTTGFLIDYGEISRLALPIIRQLDHTHLNDIADLKYTTTEHIAGWLWERIKNVLPLLVEITVRESQFTGCTYRGE